MNFFSPEGLLAENRAGRLPVSEEACPLPVAKSGKVYFSLRADERKEAKEILHRIRRTTDPPMNQSEALMVALRFYAQWEQKGPEDRV